MLISQDYVKIKAEQVIRRYMDGKNFISKKTMNPTRIKIMNTIHKLIDKKDNVSDKDIYDSISMMVESLRNSDAFGITGKSGSSFLMLIDEFLADIKPVIDYQESEEVKAYKAFGAMIERTYLQYVALKDDPEKKNSDELKGVIRILRDNLYIRYNEYINEDEKFRTAVNSVIRETKMEGYELDYKPSVDALKFSLQWDEAASSPADYPLWCKFQKILEPCFLASSNSDFKNVIDLMNLPLRKSVSQFKTLLGVGIQESSFSNQEEDKLERSSMQLNPDQVKSQQGFEREKSFWLHKRRLLTLYVDCLKKVLLKNKINTGDFGFAKVDYDDLARKIWNDSLAHIVCIAHNFSGGPGDIAPYKNFMPTDCDFKTFEGQMTGMLIQEGLLDAPMHYVESSRSHSDLPAVSKQGIFAQPAPREELARSPSVDSYLIGLLRVSDLSMDR